MKKLYSIGTIVDLQNQCLMIVGLLTKVDGIIYDYIGVPFPYGYMDENDLILFQHEDIQNVKKIGYISNDTKKFMNRIQNYLEKH